MLLVAGVSGPAGAAPTLLFEPASGRVLYAEDQDDHWHPASLTKIMTAYMTFAALKSGRVTLETKIACSEAAHVQPPSKIGLPVGGEITVDLALKALIIKSANDVAVMLAEAIGGSEAQFVEQMNATARRLGMSRTNFVNPNGLPAPEQVTTARDLAKLSAAVTRDFPEFAHYWSMPDMMVGKRRLRTHNQILRVFEGGDGLKTGFICDSGYNVVASATRDGRRLMAVVLGQSSRDERTSRAMGLLEHGFLSHDWKALLGAPSLATLPVDASAKPVTRIRASVLNWDCGGRRKARAVVAKARKAKPAGAPAETASADAASGSVGDAKPATASPAKAAAKPPAAPAKAAAAPAGAPAGATTKASAAPAVGTTAKASPKPQ